MEPGFGRWAIIQCARGNGTQDRSRASSIGRECREGEAVTKQQYDYGYFRTSVYILFDHSS